jgi:hypothetical protein
MSTKEKLHEMLSDELVKRFVAYALDQEKALLRNDVAQSNLLFRKMETLESELKSRAGDQRHKLLVLLSHDNVQVRLKAAEATLALAPELARRVLEAISNSGAFPQAGHAGMALDALERGIFKPS